MEVGKLTAEYRALTGKAPNRRLRAAGKIPAVVYGQGAEPVPVAIDPSLLLKALDPIKKSNTVIQLTVDGGPGGKKQLTVMVRDYQRDELRGDLTHADFVLVDMNKDVHAVVPVVLTGRAEGVKVGGIMHQVLHRIDISCRPDRIPAKIEIDVTTLALNESLHVSDLKLGEGLKALTPPGQTVCAVTVPKAEKEEAPAAAVVEGAEGAAAAAPGAPGAAPLAGAAPAAGTAPAAGEKKAPEKKGKKE